MTNYCEKKFESIVSVNYEVEYCEKLKVMAVFRTFWIKKISMQLSEKILSIGSLFTSAKWLIRKLILLMSEFLRVVMQNHQKGC